MTSEEAIEYGKRWYAAIESQGEPAQSDALTFLAWANLALQERKTGKWEIKYSKHGVIFPICSNCDYAATNWVKTKYCPNCGAKMEVEE